MKTKSSRVFMALCLLSPALGLAGCDVDSGEPADLELATTGDDADDADDDGTSHAVASTENAAYIPVLPAHRLDGAAAKGEASDLWSGVQVQNLGAEPTKISLSLYNWDGSLETTVERGPVQSGASINIIAHQVRDDWSGYAIATAETGARVEATINLYGVNPDFDQNTKWDTSTAGDSYEATTEPGETWQLPYLNLDDRTTIWVTNTEVDKPAAEIFLRFSDDTQVSLGVLAGGHGAGFSLPDLGITKDSHGSADSSKTKNVTSAELFARRPDNSRVAVAVAVTSVGSEGVVGVPEAALPNVYINSMTSYTPPRFGDNVSPLVNFQRPQQIDIDTVIYAQRVDGESYGLMGLDELSEVERSTLFMDYVYRDENEQLHKCTETAFGVGSGEVVDFGWSFFNRNAGDDEGVYRRASTCPELSSQGIAVGWAKASSNAVTVVTQEYRANPSNPDRLVARRSAYSGAHFGTAAGQKISFSLTQSNNPVDAVAPGNWTGVSLVNPGDEEVRFTCTFYNSAPSAMGSPLAQSRSHQASLAPRSAIDLQLYEDYLWDGMQNYGSGVCEVEGEGRIMGVANQQFGWSGAPMSYRAVSVDSPNCDGFGSAAVVCGDDGFQYRDSLDANGCGRPIDSCKVQIADCEYGALCSASLTCIDGLYYASGCGPLNCDTPLELCDG